MNPVAAARAPRYAASRRLDPPNITVDDRCPDGMASTIRTGCDHGPASPRAA